jgi:hypothetical protein
MRATMRRPQKSHRTQWVDAELLDLERFGLVPDLLKARLDLRELREPPADLDLGGAVGARAAVGLGLDRRHGRLESRIGLKEERRKPEVRTQGRAIGFGPGHRGRSGSW